MSGFFVVLDWGSAKNRMKVYLVPAEGPDRYEWAEDDRAAYGYELALTLAAEFGGRVEAVSTGAA